MKIYNKKTFAEGISISLLGLVLLLTIFITSFDIKKMIISTLSLLVGIGLLQRSFSKAMAIEDKTDEFDERNRLISIKAKGKSLQITQIASWILMLFLLIIGDIKNNTFLISLGTGIMIPFVMSLFGELFCVIYYETKN